MLSISDVDPIWCLLNLMNMILAYVVLYDYDYAWYDVIWCKDIAYGLFTRLVSLCVL